MRFVVVLVLAVVPCFGQATKELNGFKGIPFGASEAEVRKSMATQKLVFFQKKLTPKNKEGFSLWYKGGKDYGLKTEYTIFTFYRSKFFVASISIDVAANNESPLLLYSDLRDSIDAEWKSVAKERKVYGDPKSDTEEMLMEKNKIPKLTRYTIPRITPCTINLDRINEDDTKNNGIEIELVDKSFVQISFMDWCLAPH